MHERRSTRGREMPRARACLVLMSDPNEEALRRSRTRLWEAYPDAHAVSETTYLVDGNGAEPRKIAETLGFTVRTKPEPTSGVVFGIGPFYSGFTRPQTWKWLARLDQDL